MNEAELIGLLCFCLPPVFTAVGFFAASLLFTARDADTRRYPRPGTQPFRPESKLKKWYRSDDMLENGQHPSRKNED